MAIFVKNLQKYFCDTLKLYQFAAEMKTFLNKCTSILGSTPSPPPPPPPEEHRW